jgi:hypothetical protein
VHDLASLTTLVEAMFASDGHGRLTGRAPHLYILRTPDGVICRCHADLPPTVATALEQRSARPRGRPREWSQEYADYLTLLSGVAPLTSMRAGPLYAFPDLPPAAGDGSVDIGEENAALLRGGLDEWLPDVALGRPMRVVVADGRAVSICTSVVASAAVHCAGVETLAAYRGHGFAARAVAGWARGVQAMGAAPFYATTFDNVASQGVARRLGLVLVGAEFSADCAIG